jgi:hypothetical protein
MRWAKGKTAGHPGSWVHKHLTFYDLLDDDGNELGFVKHDNRPGHGYTPNTTHSDGLAQFPTQSTLKQAKALLVAHFVAKKLEDTP